MTIDYSLLTTVLWAGFEGNLAKVDVITYRTLIICQRCNNRQKPRLLPSPTKQMSSVQTGVGGALGTKATILDPLKTIC